MAQIVGKYQHVSNGPEFEDYLKVLEVPEEMIKPIVSFSPVLTISEAGDKWTIITKGEGHEHSVTFKLDEPYDEAIGDVVLKNIAKRDGNKLTIKITLPKGKVEIRVYEFSETGINVTLTESESGMSVPQVFKRI